MSSPSAEGGVIGDGYAGSQRLNGIYYCKASREGLQRESRALLAAQKRGHRNAPGSKGFNRVVSIETEKANEARKIFREHNFRTISVLS